MKMIIPVFVMSLVLFSCCLLTLQAWKGFIENVDTLTGGAIPFLFDLPVCIDTEDRKQ